MRGIYGITGFARDVLAVADNMHRALEARSTPRLREKADANVKALIEGVELTERELLKVLEKHGVKKFSPAGREVRSRTCIRRCSRCRIPNVPPGTSRRSCRPATCSASACCARRWSASPRRRRKRRRASANDNSADAG